MIVPLQTERWPPVYDAEDLNRTIRQIVEAPDLSAAFFDSVTRGGAVCQGDILRFTSPVPLIDEIGEAVADGEVDFWLVIGNTCDFYRDDAKWTQVVPLDTIAQPVPEQAMRDLRSYRLARRFYVPSWPGADEKVALVADFLRPVAMHKATATTKARVVARLSRSAWVLLHSALIRFLARDDGRFA